MPIVTLTVYYTKNNVDLSERLYVNSSSNQLTTINNSFNGINLSNGTQDSIDSYYFSATTYLTNVSTNYLINNNDIINYCYPRLKTDYLNSINVTFDPTTLLFGLKIILFGASGGGGGGGGSCTNGSIIYGAGGGGSGSTGSFEIIDIPLSLITTNSFNAIVGSGGLGGTGGILGNGVNATNGSNGGDGGLTSFTIGSSTFSVNGGLGGIGGKGGTLTAQGLGGLKGASNGTGSNAGRNGNNGRETNGGGGAFSVAGGIAEHSNAYVLREGYAVRLIMRTPNVIITLYKYLILQSILYLTLTICR